MGRRNWYPKGANRPGKWYVAGNIMRDSSQVNNNNCNGMRGPAELAQVNTPRDADVDGYTNVEEFLNGTNPQEKINYRNLGNNVDKIS